MPQFSFHKVIILSLFLFVTAQLVHAQTNSYSLHKIKKGETLSTIAKANKTTVAELMHLNNLTAKSVLKLGKNIKTPVKQTTTSTPTEAQATTTPTPTVSSETTEQTPGYKLHIIKPKESFSSIARQNETTVAAIMKLNGLNTKSVLKPGETIKIPVKETLNPPPIETMSTLVTTESKPGESPNYSEHIIKPKESLYSIARANHTTVEAIMRLNGMNAKSILKDGASIKIPNNASFTTIEVPVKRTPTPEVIAPLQPTYTEHTVKAKETLLSLAKANHTTITAILNLNDMKAKRPLKRGESIKIPSKTESLSVTKSNSSLPPLTTIATNPSQETNYTEYTIKPKQTLSSIAKVNHTTVGDIMRLNGMNSKSHLKSGTVLRIPGTGAKTIVTPSAVMPYSGPIVKDKASTNSAVTTTSNMVTTTRPIKYIVNKKDNLYKISKQFKTTDAQLMEWNGMKNDVVRAGMGLIVGQETVTMPVTKDTVANIQKTNSIPTFIAKDTSRLAKDATRVVKDTIPTRVYHPTIDSTFNGRTKNIEEAVARSQSLDIVDPAPIPKYAKYAEKEGFYAGYFDRTHLSDNTTTGEAAAFKSTSGWEDKKFYILINDINQGSIVRITVNDKSICAKVMGPLPPVKEDNGLVARISNAAAEALGVQDVVRFGVTINY